MDKNSRMVVIVDDEIVVESKMAGDMVISPVAYTSMKPTLIRKVHSTHGGNISKFGVAYINMRGGIFRYGEMEMEASSPMSLGMSPTTLGTLFEYGYPKLRLCMFSIPVVIV